VRAGGGVMGNGVHVPRRSWTATAGAWVDRAFSALFVVVLGVLLGFQYMAPDKRVLSALAGVVVAGIAWRLEIIAGIGVMIVALPFPKGLSFGTTNLALVLMVGVIYLLRVGQRELPRPRGTRLDLPIVGLIIAYCVSFYNVDPENLKGAIWNFETFLATLLMYFVVTNSVQTESDLRRLHQFQVWSLLAFSVVAFWELANPGKALVPGWIDFTQTLGEVFNTRNVRIGGTFYDYELLADFCGLNIILLIFLWIRAVDLYRRILYGGLLAATVFLLFSTVTRGPIFSLSAATAYLLWLMRRRLRVVPVTIGAAAIAATLLVANFVVSNFTRSGNLFLRLSGTEFTGFVPDTRVTAWQTAWNRFLLHPLIGCGPYYAVQKSLTMWFWPHDLYLYVANIVGLFGLVFFVLMLWNVFVVTTPRVDSPAEGSYTESYMLVARVQFVFFLVDQTKIEYLRNSTYQYVVWLMFALWVAADRIRREQSPTLAAAARPRHAHAQVRPARLSPRAPTA
jgi:O-antigen ligase